MLIGASSLVSAPPSLPDAHCAFRALTCLHLLSHPQTLHLIAVVLQPPPPSPLSLCLLLRSSLLLFLSGVMNGVAGL